jgi:lysozyme family protein
MKLTTQLLVGFLLISIFLFPACHREKTDSKFQYAMKTVLKHEGGLSNNKKDPGGITKYGISLRYLQNEKFDLNGDGEINKDDVIQLTQTEADTIYYKEWYIKHRYNEIIDKDILTDVMDFSINAGASQCHKTLKRAINSIISDKIEVNGEFDDQTIEIVNLIEPVVLHDALNQEQEKFYRSLVKKNPSLSVFLDGWIKRSRD